MQIVTVGIKGLAYGGAFIGEVSDEGSVLKGKKAFIRGACAGEVVEAEVLEEKSSYIEAKLLRVIESSAERVPAPCPYFAQCGGCDLQHLALSAQREAKMLMVRDMLRMQGGLSPLRGVTLVGRDPPGTAYRRRITLHLDHAGQLGFYRPNSGDVVAIERCLIARQRLNEAIVDLLPRAQALCEWVGGVVLEEHGAELFVLLKLHDGVRWDGARDRVLALLHKVFENLSVLDGKHEYPLLRRGRTPQGQDPPIGHFSQVNEEGNAVLIQTVCEWTAGRDVTELYAGAGNLSLALAEQGARVTAVEVDGALIRYGKALAAERRLTPRVEFVHTSAQRYVRSHRIRGTVLLDPPRTGAKEVVREFSAARVPRIVYVSCSLPNFVRDLKLLHAAGFSLDEVRVLDMFPQTHHVECIALISAAAQG